jgi:arginase
MDVSLISVPYDQDIYYQSMGLGPEALLAAGLVARLEEVGLRVVNSVEASLDLGEGDRIARLGRLGATVAGHVADACVVGTLPIILGGDCMNSIGMVAGLRKGMAGKKLGVAWYDAHGDFNTPETTLSGYLPGMPLACICGLGLDELRQAIGLEEPIDTNHVVMFGIRDLDDPEKELLDSTPISYLNPEEVKAGRSAVAIEYHLGKLDGVYLHLDIDAIDPREAPGVDYRTPGGISVQEVIEVGREVKVAAPIAAVVLAAVNPPKDKDGKTVKAGIRLLVGILGKG